MRSMLSLALLVPALLPARRPGAEIQLTVTDPSGAAMEATGRLDRACVSYGRAGSIRVRDLPFGHYRLEVSREGFAAQP